MHTSLAALQRALQGLVVLSAELEAMGNAMYDQRVPSLWSNTAYPSLKPLTPWFKDLLQRLEFVTSWEENGVPAVYWISGRLRFLHLVMVETDVDCDLQDFSSRKAFSRLSYKTMQENINILSIQLAFPLS